MGVAAGAVSVIRVLISIRKLVLRRAVGARRPGSFWVEGLETEGV
jgi:hypothetical protein